MQRSLTVSLWLGALGVSLAAPDPTFETVKTANGPIIGHRETKAADVWEYLGIPYAQPPLGDLRFASPQAYTPQGPYNATNFVSAHSVTSVIRSVN
jgi:cholinesterase